MINILMPMSGKSLFYDTDEFHFPKPLVEIEGEPMIACVVKGLTDAEIKKKFIFVVNQEDVKKYHFDRVLRLLVGEDGIVIEQLGETQGAIPSCLLAIDDIDLDKPLLISNSDQVLDVSFDDVIRYFENHDADGGVVTFESVHPQWSYVAFDENGYIAQAAEKNPISSNAIAGIYYYAKGQYFIDSAMSVIRKGYTLNGKYYLSSTINEMVLDRRKLFAYKIDKKQYHSFYSPEMLQDYKELIASR